MRSSLVEHSRQFIQSLKALNIYLKSAIIVIVFLAVYHVFTNINSGIHPIHEWRKSDSMSIALNYYKGSPFLEPQTQWISEVGNRNAAAEFPIYYYVIGKIWLLTGPNDSIYKLGSLLIFLIGLVLFSQVASSMLKSDQLALLLVIFLMSSPVLLFYAEAGIPNPLAFSFMLISFWFIYHYIHSERSFYLAGFFAFSSLSILVKITALIAYASFGGAALLFILFYKRNWLIEHRKKLITLLLSSAGSIVLVYLWYSYAIRYNHLHTSGLFSTTIRPAWEVSAAERAFAGERLIEAQLPRLLYIPSFLLLSISTLFIVYRKNQSNFIKWLIPIQLIAVVSYLTLWFWVFTEHDYYLIEIFFLPVTFAFILLYYISKQQGRRKLRLTVFFGILLLVNILHTNTYCYHAFGLNKKETKDDVFMDKKSKDAWAWYHYNHDYHLAQLIKNKSRIQEIIPKEDTIFCVSDHTPNTHLYTLNRIGYTYYSYTFKPEAETINKLVKTGVKYVVKVGNEEMDKQFDPLFENKIASFEGVSIYRVNSNSIP